MPAKKQEQTAAQKFKDIGTKIGAYLLAIAAIIGGLRAIILEVWPERSAEIPTISAENTCPLFLGSIPSERHFDLSLNEDGSLPIADQIILVRFLDEIGVIGYLTVSHPTGSNMLLIHDTADDRCLGIGRSYYEVNSGGTTEIELKGGKAYMLFMDLNSAGTELHIRLTKK